MLDLDADSGHDQDQRALPMAIKPAAARVDAESTPVSPGACSSLSSIGPSLFTGSPFGGAPQQDSKGDVSSRYGAADDQQQQQQQQLQQQQQFKWSENPMLSTVSPAASLSTPNSGAGIFHTPAPMSQLQLRGAGDKFFTPYNNSAFSDANVGSSDQFYTPGPVEHGMHRSGPPSAGRQASSRSPHALAQHQSSSFAGCARAEAPHENAQGTPSTVSLRSVSNVGSPASPCEISSRVPGGTDERQQGAQRAASLRSISNVGIPLDEGAGEGEQQSGEWDDGSECGGGGGDGEDAALSPDGSMCGGNLGECVPADEAEHQVEGDVTAAAAAAGDDGENGLASAGQLLSAPPEPAPSAEAQFNAPDSPVALQRTHSASISPFARSQQGGLHGHEDKVPHDDAPLLSAAEGGIQEEVALAPEQQQQRDHTVEGHDQPDQDHYVEGEGQGQDVGDEGQGEDEEDAVGKGKESRALRKNPLQEEGEDQARAAVESRGEEEEAAAVDDAAENGQAGAEEAAYGLGGTMPADLGVEEAAAAAASTATAAVGVGGTEGPCAANLSAEEAAPAATAAAVGAEDAWQAGKGAAIGHANRTGSPTRHDPRVFAAILSSKGRQGRWLCGHAATSMPPPPPPQHHHPKPNTTAIPDHLLKASHLVLRTNRPEPDPVSARRLKMTVPKTPVLATAQRLGSHPHALQSPGPSFAAPTAPTAAVNRPRRASCTDTHTRTQSAREHAAEELAAPSSKPRRASYTHTPPRPSSTTPAMSRDLPALPAAPLQPGSQDNKVAAAAAAGDNVGDAAAIAAHFASLPSRVTSLESRRAAAAAPASERGMAATDAAAAPASALPGSTPMQLAVTCAEEAGAASVAPQADTAAPAPTKPANEASAQGSTDAPTGAAVNKAAGSPSTGPRECARASAAAAAAAAARAKAQQAPPLKQAANGTQPASTTSHNPSQASGTTEAQHVPVSHNPKQVAGKAPGSGSTPPHDGGAQALRATGAVKDAEQAKQADAPAGPGHKAAPARATATPPKARPHSSAAVPTKKAAGATAVRTNAQPQSTPAPAAQRGAGTARAAVTPTKPWHTNTTASTPEHVETQRAAAASPPPRALQQRSASVAPQQRGVERKAWPGLPPTRAQQRSASVTQGRRLAPPASSAAAPPCSPILHATAATTTPERHKGRPAAAAIRPRAQHAPAHHTPGHKPTPSPTPAAVVRPASPAPGAAGCSSKAQRPATSRALTATPPKATAPAHGAAIPKVQRPSTSPAPSTTPHKGAPAHGVAHPKVRRPSSSPAPTATFPATPPKGANAQGAAVPKVRQPASSPAPSATPPKAAPARGDAAPKAQHPAVQGVDSKGHRSATPLAAPLAAGVLPAAAKAGSRPGVATSTASKAAAAPPAAAAAAAATATQKKPGAGAALGVANSAAPAAAAAAAAAPVVSQRKPAVPKLGRRPRPPAPAPTAAPAAPPAPLEPLPSFFKKPGVPRLSAKATAAAAAPAACAQFPGANKANKQAAAAAARANQQAEAVSSRANKQAEAGEAKSRKQAEAAAARTHKHPDGEADKAKAHKQATGGVGVKVPLAEHVAQQARVVEQARMEAEAAVREAGAQAAESKQGAEATHAQQEEAGAEVHAQEEEPSMKAGARAQEQDPSVNAEEAAAGKEGDKRVVHVEEEEAARAALTDAGECSTAAPVFVRPQVPKLNMEAVAAAAARDNEEEEKAHKGHQPVAAPAASLHPSLPSHAQHSAAGFGAAAAFKAPAVTAPAKPVKAALAAEARAQQCHQGPPRPTTAPAAAGATAAAQSAAAGAVPQAQGPRFSAAAGGVVGASGTSGAAAVGQQPRRNSAAGQTQVQPPGMWSSPLPLCSSTSKAQRQLPSTSPAAAARKAQGYARRSPCAAAATYNDTEAAGQPPPSRAAAMAARLQAVKEEGGASQHHKQAPTCSSSNNNASSKGGLSSTSASPTKSMGRVPAREQQVRVSPVGGMTFGTPMADQKLSSNRAHNRYSSNQGPTEDANKEEASPSLTPKPRRDAPTDLSLAWATTPCTSLSFERTLQPAAPASAMGSSVSLNNSPSGSDTVPQMPSLGAGLLVPTPFVPASGAAAAAPSLHDSLSSSGGSFSLDAGHQPNVGCDVSNGTGQDAAALPRQGGSLGERQPPVTDSCRRSSWGGRPSLGAAAMTPVLMHPFAVATPAPHGMEQVTPRLGLQSEKGAAEIAATPAGLAMLSPAPQLPSAQELQQLVHMQHAQQGAQASVEQPQQQAVEQQREHPTDIHLKANLPASDKFEWDAASYEVCSPVASAPQGCSGGSPRPLPLYEEWGSPDDSPIQACTEACAQQQAREPTDVSKLQAPKASVKHSLDVAAAQSNFSFTSEIGALRMSIFEPVP